MRLTVVMATRGRPKMAVEAARSYHDHALLPSTRVMIAADADDYETIEAFRAAPFAALSVRKREDSVGAKWNRALEESKSDVYLCVVDHAEMATFGYDKEILDKADLFPDAIGCVYTPMANASFPYFQAITHRMADIVGRIYPTYFPYWFVDHWLDDVARMIGRIAMVDVKINDTRPARTHELRDVKLWSALFDLLRDERRAEANALLDNSLMTSWQKEMLRSAFPMHEVRSLWINDYVRAQADIIEQSRGAQGEPDERYARLKAAAEKRVRELAGAQEWAA